MPLVGEISFLGVPSLHTAREFWVGNGFSREQANAIFDAFGLLNDEGKAFLLWEVRWVIRIYRAERAYEKEAQRIRERDDKIVRRAKELLALLDDRISSGADPWAYMVQVPPASIRARKGTANRTEGASATPFAPPESEEIIQRKAEFREVLELLAHQLDDWPRQPVAQHGGDRRSVTSTPTALTRNLIEIYVACRTRWPDSGPKPAFGGPLMRFLRASIAVAGLKISDNTIKDAYFGMKKNKVLLSNPK
jgi:hypothetical protein